MVVTDLFNIPFFHNKNRTNDKTFVVKSKNILTNKGTGIKINLSEVIYETCFSHIRAVLPLYSENNEVAEAGTMY